jgi:hypothetical protein
MRIAFLADSSGENDKSLSFAPAVSGSREFTMDVATAPSDT